MSVETRIMCLKQRGNPIYMFPGNKTSWLSRYCRLPKALNLRLAQDLSLKRRLSSVKDFVKLSPPLNQDGNNRKGKHFLAIRVPFSDVPTPFILISYSTTLGHRILRDGSETLRLCLPSLHREMLSPLFFIGKPPQGRKLCGFHQWQSPGQGVWGWP